MLSKILVTLSRRWIDEREDGGGAGERELGDMLTSSTSRLIYDRKLF